METYTSKQGAIDVPPILSIEQEVTNQEEFSVYLLSQASNSGQPGRRECGPKRSVSVVSMPAPLFPDQAVQPINKANVNAENGPIKQGILLEDAGEHKENDVLKGEGNDTKGEVGNEEPTIQRRKDAVKVQQSKKDRRYSRRISTPCMHAAPQRPLLRPSLSAAAKLNELESLAENTELTEANEDE